MKERKRGKYWTKIETLHGPALTSRRGMSAAKRKRQIAAFVEWAKEDNKRWEETFDIRRVIKDLKPALTRYLKTKGFVKIPSGLAKKIGRRFEPPSPEWAEIAKSMLHKQPKDQDAKRILRVAQKGRILANYFFIEDAYDKETLAYFSWQSLQLIKLLESALARGDITHACGFAHQLGRVMREAEIFGSISGQGRENRVGWHSRNDWLLKKTVEAIKAIRATGEKPQWKDTYEWMEKAGVFRDKRFQMDSVKPATWRVHYFGPARKMNISP